jgi:predicted metal-dependent HD superfamily phosphohydrolase
MSAPVLARSWQRTWQLLYLAGEGGDLRDALLARYAEPHRAYHSQQHLAECLAVADGALDLADHPGEVLAALWFHDAVYDIGRHDNEARSADWAREALVAAGAAPEVAQRVAQQVLATRHAALPEAGDAQLVVDVDLSILGAGPERFAEYEAQIRQEYAAVPAALFRERRSQVLAAFLARPVLYATPRLRQALEARARANLQQALAATAG